MSKPTAAQRRRFERVAALGCLACGGPACIHHCRHECGMSQRNHDHIAPLCRWCHQDGPVSRHRAPAMWDDKELHEETQRRLGEI